MVELKPLSEDAMNVEKLRIIQTSSIKFDELLGGGVHSGQIVEAFGSYGSGKSQLGFQLLINTLKLNPRACAVLIDTERTAFPQRIVEIGRAAGLKETDLLSRIFVVRPTTVQEQIASLGLVKDTKASGTDVALVVVDSITSLFRVEFIGSKKLAQRQRMLTEFVRDLQGLVASFDIAVYITNQVLSKPDFLSGGSTEQASGGSVLAHGSTQRLYLRHPRRGLHVARLVDSPNLPDREIPFTITSKGITDVLKD